MKRMAAAGACALAAVVTALPAMAQSQERGVYLGAAYGQATAHEFCDPSAGITITNCDDKASAWKIFGGYQVNRNLAIEGTYLQTNDFFGTAVRGGTRVDVGVDALAYGIAALGMLPLGQRFSLFGKLGILAVEAEGQGSSGGVSVSVGDDETSLHYGVGVLFNITPKFGIRGEWEKAEKSEISILSIGLQYRF